MRFSETAVNGVWLVEPDRLCDDRGYFARTFCSTTFASMGLCASFAQCSTSFNSRRGTLRGLHWQDEPYAEVKLVRCTRGAIFDVAVDLRPGSETLRRWVGVELTEANGNQLYLPAGVAHGFQTLTDNAEVFYQITPAFSAEHAKGARWDDLAFGITWPIDQPILSHRDASFPWLDPQP